MIFPAKSNSAARKLPAPPECSAASSPQISMKDIAAAVPANAPETEQNAAHRAEVMQPAPVILRSMGFPLRITAVRSPSEITSIAPVTAQTQPSFRAAVCAASRGDICVSEESTPFSRESNPARKDISERFPRTAVSFTRRIISAADSLRNARRAMNGISSLDSAYEELAGRIETLAEEADDAAGELSEIADGLYFDENEARNVENRLDEIRALQRKYAVKEQSEIAAILEEKEKEYDLLSDGAEKSVRLQKEMSEDLKKIYSLCLEMSEIRRKTAEKFCAGVCDELKTLNIPHATFSVSFKEFSEADAERATENGLDDISFMFSANAGEPQKPLGKIISGGEMSRFMLAIKTRLSDLNGISTYVFDEIDAGISGKTAKVVGEKFAKIAKTTQIIAVSHLAQIACMSDKEFLIEKKEEGGKTRSYIRPLDQEEQKAEIVRLLGGENGEKAALLHAEELLEKARNFKAGL